MRNLTPKQQRFVEAYTGIARGNATEAARLAGYRGNRRTLEAVGRENLGKPRVAKAIQDATAEVRQAAIMTREEIMAGLTAMARGKGEEPHVLQSGETVYAGPAFRDREKAMMDLAKMQGLLIDRLEVKAADALREKLRELRQKMPRDAFEALLRALAPES